MTNAAIDTVILFAHDLQKLSGFYIEALQIDREDVVDEEGHVGFDLGDIYLGFDQSDGSHQHPGAVTFWARVDDLDATYELCLRLGATSLIEPVWRPWGDRLAAVKDPEGNVVGFSLRRDPEPEADELE
ncbi:MAG: VOC family protein [Acidimicrobiia bacterium]